MRDVIIGACVAIAASWLVVDQEPSRARDRTIQELLGHPPSARLLVLHADDLGMAHSVNRATFEALEQGLITSASILVPCPWFPEVARWARAHPDADLGIHLALNSEWTGFRWGPVSSAGEVPSLLDADGYLPLTEQPVVARARIPEVERELRAQIDRARAAGIRITHLDSHMGTLFRSRELFDAYRRIGRDYGLPVLQERQGDRGGTGAQWQAAADPDALIDRVISIGPGVPTADWLPAYEKLLSPLPPGVYQLIVHLAYDDAEMRGATWDHPDWGAAWRQADLDLVRSPAFRQFLQREGFVLVTWKELASAALRKAEEDRDRSTVDVQNTKTARLLYLTHSAGFRHDVLPLTQEVVREIGRTSGAYEATVTEDVSLLSEAGLRDYDAVAFYTTGELPMNDGQKRALMDFVTGGKGFVGIHSATDTFYDWPEYGEMIGAYFDGHPWHAAVGIRVEDGEHPATRHLPARFEMTDEIYQFRNWSRAGVHVLLSLDPASVDLSAKGVKRTDRDFALAWTRQHGKGRVFYTALGHDAAVWRDDRFRRHLLGGITWAMGAARP